MRASNALRLRAGASYASPLLLAAALPWQGMAVASTPSLAEQRPTSAQHGVRCETASLGRDRLVLVCHIDPSGVRRVRLRVHLTGSHDDTTASMEVAAGDVPVSCESGSKASTEGEDGDVTLDCRLTVSSRAGATTTLRASARWFHAQYVGYQVDDSQP